MRPGNDQHRQTQSVQRTQGVLETVLQSNPGLSELGAILLHAMLEAAR